MPERYCIAERLVGSMKLSKSKKGPVARISFSALLCFFKEKLRSWLGIDGLEDDFVKLEKLYSDLVSIGVDVHFKEPHMILIYSKLNGGQIRHIPANFKTMKELQSFVQWLKEKYSTDIETWDHIGINRDNWYR